MINFETVKSFGKEGEEISAFKELENAFRDKYIWYNASLNVLSFGQGVLVSGGLVFALTLAVKGAIAGSLSAGDLVLILTYTEQLLQPLLVSCSYNPLLCCAPLQRTMQAQPAAEKFLFFFLCPNHSLHNYYLYSLLAFCIDKSIKHSQTWKGVSSCSSLVPL